MRPHRPDPLAPLALYRAAAWTAWVIHAQLIRHQRVHGCCGHLHAIAGQACQTAGFMVGQLEAQVDHLKAREMALRGPV